MEVQAWIGRQLLDPQQRVYIGSDAATIGWDATHGRQSTGGFRSESERKKHINTLELLAAKFVERNSNSEQSIFQEWKTSMQIGSHRSKRLISQQRSVLTSQRSNRPRSLCIHTQQKVQKVLQLVISRPSGPSQRCLC